MRTYDSYKDSGIEWIGMIPSTWKVSRFNHNFSFSRGLPITKQDLKDNGIPCVSYGEIHSKFGRIVDPEKHELKFADESFLESNPNSLLYRGDFLFADTSEDLEGSGNFTCLDSDIPTFAGYHTVIARLFNRHEFDYKYLSYFLDSIEFRNQIRSSVSGIKVFSITQGILKSTSIVIPQPREQSAIASYLDRKTAEIDQLIADKKRLLELYEEEKTAVINQAVTKGINPDAPMKYSGIEWLGEIPEHWEVKKLRHIKAPIKNSFVDGPFGSNLKTEHFIENGDVYVIDSGFITSGKFEFNREFKTISFEHFLTVNRSECNYRDIIIAKIGANFGMSGILPKLEKPSLVSGNTLKLTVNKDKYDIDFIHKQLLCLKWAGEIDLLVKGSAQPALSMGPMSELSFAIPNTLEEQKAIINHIEFEYKLLDNKKAKAQKLIDLLTEYRTALISEVVTGKVKVID